MIERVLKRSSRYPERPKLVSSEGIIEIKYYKECDKRIEDHWWIRRVEGMWRVAGPQTYRGEPERERRKR